MARFRRRVNLLEFMSHKSSATEATSSVGVAPHDSAANGNRLSSFHAHRRRGAPSYYLLFAFF